MNLFQARKLVYLAAPLLLLNLGCKKTPPPPETVVVKTSTPAPTPAPDPSTLPVAPVTVNGATIEATSGLPTSAVWSIKQDDIKNDPQGQWASEATASSTYNDDKDQDRFSA